MENRLTPVKVSLLSPAAMLFGRPVRGLMPYFNRSPINNDTVEEHYNVLLRTHHKMVKMSRSINQNDGESLPIGASVTVQREDNSPWTHGTIIAHGDTNYYNKS